LIYSFCPKLRNMQNSTDRFFHILYRNPLLTTVKRMPTRKNVRARKSHLTQPRAICTATDASSDGLHTCPPDGLHANIHNFRILVQNLLHIPILLSHRPFKTTSRKLGSCQFCSLSNNFC